MSEWLEWGGGGGWVITVPTSTALDASKPAIDDEKACNESYVLLLETSMLPSQYTYIDLIPITPLISFTHTISCLSNHCQDALYVILRHTLRIPRGQKHIKRPLCITL
jgi:hypothetical protein